MHEFVFCDVFTDRPLAGNQLAVFPDATGIPEEGLQPLAREIGFSETVFCYPPDAGGDVRVRIFTPLSEFAFAGHPALGTAVVVGGDRGEVTLETGAGAVPVQLERGGGSMVLGRMRQPLPSVEPFPDEGELLAALGISRSELPIERYDNGMRHLYVALPSERDVASLEPDLGVLATLTPGTGVNCFAGEGRRWKTRMFDPGDGIPEDPATGSAAGPLAVHLARHGRIGFGEEITISQGVELGRPSILYARAEGSRDAAEGSPDALSAVEVAGGAVVVARGAFELP